MQYDCDRDLNPNSSPSTCNPSPSTQVDMAVDVNFQYLKHVVIKFVCSREDEALQLIRALSTLLKFSPQEEEHVKSYLNYKVILFHIVHTILLYYTILLDVMVWSHSTSTLST